MVFLLGWTLGDVKRLFAGSTELREGSQSQILIVVLRFESGQLPFCAKRQQNARSGNRTRVASLGGLHHATRLNALMLQRDRRVLSSVVEHSTADREVAGSSPAVPWLFFCHKKDDSQSAGFEPARVTPIDFKSIAVTTWLRLLALETFVAPAPGETSQSARGTEKTVAGGRSREISARQFEECTFREEKRRERRGERREKERETVEKEKKMRSPGVEPGSQAWRACRLPLPHKRWLGIGRSLDLNRQDTCSGMHRRTPWSLPMLPHAKK